MNSSLRPDLPYHYFTNGTRCLLWDPTDGEPHFLRLRLGPPLPPSGCCVCGKHDSFGHYTFHYYCTTCDVQFHEHCHMWPREMRHLCHHQHPLSFSFLRPDGTLITHGNYREYLDLHYPDPDIVHGKCDWCGDDLNIKNHFYRCSLCGFILCWICFIGDVRLTITNSKAHPHPLNFFPRPLSPCDACGLTDAKDPTYACLQCLYIVHQSCLRLPRIIKITRHPQHRLSHVPYLSPDANRSCGVCHRRVDPKYGSYHCTQDCHYTLHSKCATRDDIWDGKELDGELEIPDEAKDIEPFVEIGDKEIIHFSHRHHSLHFIVYNGGVHEANKQCQACILQIDFGNYYSCKKCDFFLHIECASLPRKMYHGLHHHPLFLDPLPELDFSSTYCSACLRATSGFKYRCGEDMCFVNFKLDLRCASSISDPVVHNLHRHSLFIDILKNRNEKCRICDGIRTINILRCFKDGCNFVTCLECGTLPQEIRYKYDDHPLTLALSYEEDRSDVYWCEVCEKQLDAKDKMMYTCEKCCTTLHVKCVYPRSIFMKAGYFFIFYKGEEVEVMWNGSSTRPNCEYGCGRCHGIIFYMTTNGCFCSLTCLYRFQNGYGREELVSNRNLVCLSGI